MLFVSVPSFFLLRKTWKFVCALNQQIGDIHSTITTDDDRLEMSRTADLSFLCGVVLNANFKSSSVKLVTRHYYDH